MDDGGETSLGTNPTDVRDFQKNVTTRLTAMTGRQDSIQALSMWMIHHKSQCQKICECWLAAMRKAKISRRLVLFYLANDVVQNCKKKNAKIYLLAFKNVLKDAVLLVRNDGMRDKIERIFLIWEERNTYFTDFINELRQLLNDRESVTAHVSSTNYQPTEVLDVMAKVKMLESSVSVKHKQVLNLKIDASKIEAVKQLKDRSNSREFAGQFDDSYQKMSNYVKILENEVEQRGKLIELLEKGLTYYDVQSDDALVVANAYRNFGIRINKLKERVDQVKSSLEDEEGPPISPTIEAPSPENSPAQEELAADQDMDMECSDTEGEISSTIISVTPSSDSLADRIAAMSTVVPGASSRDPRAAKRAAAYNPQEHRRTASPSNHSASQSAKPLDYLSTLISAQAGGSSPKTSGSVLKNLTEFADKVKNPPPQSWQDYKRKQEMQIQQQIDKSEAEQAAIEVFEKDAARKRTAEERESADRPAEQEVADSEARETVEKDAVSKEAVARVNSQRKVDAIQYQPDTEMQSSINQPSSKNPSLYVPTPIQSTQSKSEVESTAALEYKPQLSGEFSPDISTAYPPEEPISDKKPSEATTKLQPAMNTQRQPSQPSAPKNLPSRPSAPSEAPPIPVIPSPPMPSSATPKLSMPTAPPPVSSAAPPRPSYPTPQSTMPLKSPPRPVNMPTRPSANVVQAVGRGKPPATISQRLVTPPRPPTFTPRFTSASSQSSQHVMQTVQTIPILGSNQSVSASFTPTPRVTATRTVGPRMVTPRPAASPAMGHLSATDQQDALDLLDNIALGGQKIQTVGQNRTPPRLPPRFTPPRPRFEQPYQPPPKRPAYHNQYNHYQGGNSYY